MEFQLARAYVFGGRAFGACFHIKFYGLSLTQSAETFHFDVGLMNEQIFAAIFGSDKAITFGFVEPFYFSIHVIPFIVLEPATTTRYSRE